MLQCVCCSLVLGDTTHALPDSMVHLGYLGFYITSQSLVLVRQPWKTWVNVWHKSMETNNIMARKTTHKNVHCYGINCIISMLGFHQIHSSFIPLNIFLNWMPYILYEVLTWHKLLLSACNNLITAPCGIVLPKFSKWYKSSVNVGCPVRSVLASALQIGKVARTTDKSQTSGSHAHWGNMLHETDIE